MSDPKITGENQETRDEKGRFIEGVSGNPEGRPKGSISITSAIKRKLEEIPAGEKKTYLEAFVLKTLKKAINDEDVQAQKMIWDHVDGKAPESIDHTTKGEKINEDSDKLELLAKKLSNELKKEEK